VTNICGRSIFYLLGEVRVSFSLCAPTTRKRKEENIKVQEIQASLLAVLLIMHGIEITTRHGLSEFSLCAHCCCRL
jgi:hypothetical protein